VDAVVLKANRGEKKAKRKEERGATNGSDGRRSDDGRPRAGAGHGGTPAASAASRAQLEARRDELTGEIEAAEARLAEIDRIFCTPGYYDTAAAAEVTGLEAERAELQGRVEHLMALWESVERQLD
jgi:hypothetical protein